MLRKLRQQTTSGFTIIEVMIVLAIAGFIMGIVFVAIPQLQRSSRNTARENDASLLSSSVGDCLTNQNGVIGSCDTWAEISPFADQTRLKQLTVAPAVTVGSGTAGSAVPTASLGTYNTTTPSIVTGVKCNASTDGAVYGTAREYAIIYQVETSSGTVTRCIGS